MKRSTPARKVSTSPSHRFRRRKAAWISSLILDKPGEARDEFFERIVPRFGDLTHDPWLAAT